MSDLELVALNLTAEYMSINSELQLFRTESGSDEEQPARDSLADEI
ncbi:hypothetical protein IC612_07200 [Planobacterium sp. GCR5]|uniref:Uncharacterized protein n=1 Tax=Planobacterium oryzisoli TaxID=2771435 RepID=A0A930YWI4_9FLAO|nr:hypothetical protein [Planobacterium oryzisoli]